MHNLVWVAGDTWGVLFQPYSSASETKPWPSSLPGPFVTPQQDWEQKMIISPVQDAKSKGSPPRALQPPNSSGNPYPLIFTQHLTPPGSLSNCSGNKSFCLKCLFLDFIKPTFDFCFHSLYPLSLLFERQRDLLSLKGQHPLAHSPHEPPNPGMHWGYVSFLILTTTKTAGDDLQTRVVEIIQLGEEIYFKTMNLEIKWQWIGTSSNSSSALGITCSARRVWALSSPVGCPSSGQVHDGY